MMSSSTIVALAWGSNASRQAVSCHVQCCISSQGAMRNSSGMIPVAVASYDQIQLSASLRTMADLSRDQGFGTHGVHTTCKASKMRILRYEGLSFRSTILKYGKGTREKDVGVVLRHSPQEE